MVHRYTKFLDYRTLEESRTAKRWSRPENPLVELVGAEWKIANTFPIWGGLLVYLERELPAA
jgi:hypothetical protein